MKALALIAALLLATIARADEPVELWRTSIFDHNKRIYMATFDADDSGEYFNSENCWATVALFIKANKGSEVQYWCEAPNQKT